jgi:hypothetical protein
MSRKGPHHKPPKHSPYAGQVTCLRCDKEFWSWDRRQNRLCVYCREAIEEQPSEEPVIRLPTRRTSRVDER